MPDRQFAVALDGLLARMEAAQDGLFRTAPTRLRFGTAARPEKDRPRIPRGRLTRHFRAVVP